MEQLLAGFARLVITPPFGLKIPGYYQTRIADGILDDLHCTAVAFEQDGKRAILFSIEAIGVRNKAYEDLRTLIAERCHMDADGVYLTAVHSHTAFRLCRPEDENEPIDIYLRMVYQKLCDCAQMAFEDLHPATLLTARGEAKGIAFIRRYRMKDGTYRTNPGVGNPDVEAMLDRQDEEVILLRVVRENAKEILMVNFGTHADVIGGTKYSGDFSGHAVRALEGAFAGDVEVIYLNGAEGDSNHVNVFQPKGTVSKGYELSKHMGRTIAGEVLKIYGKAKPMQSQTLDFANRIVDIPKNTFDPAMLPEYRKAADIYNREGKDAPYFKEKMGAPYVEALRVIRNLDHPPFYPLHVSAVRLGDAVFTGFPGEPFTKLGLEVKEKSPFPVTVVTSCTNGSDGYFPTPEAYEVGGYEKMASPFSSECGTILVKNALEMAEELCK